MIKNESGEIKSGDLVELFVYDPHHQRREGRARHVGIFVEHAALHSGWKILTDEGLKDFTPMWWICKKIL